MGDLYSKVGERETRQKSVSLPPKAGELASLSLLKNNFITNYNYKNINIYAVNNYVCKWYNYYSGSTGMEPEN